MGGRRKPHTTMRGYGPPSTPDAPDESDQAASLNGPDAPAAGGDDDRSVVSRSSRPPAPGSDRPPRRGTPMVEIEVVHEHGPAPHTERPWRTLEVWTRNRVYILDPTLLCVEVRDRGNRGVVTDHPFLGMRLVGGQHREGDNIELSYPFPRPGTEAVFEQPNGRRGAFSRTSAVTRVVLRLHIITVAPNVVVPTWEEITGALELGGDGSGTDDAEEPEGT